MKKSFLRKQIFHRHSMNYVVLFPYAKNIKKVLPSIYLSNWFYQLTRKIKKSFLITALILSASEVDQKFRIKNRYHNVLSDKPTFLLVYLSLFGKRLWYDTLFVTLKTATLIKITSSTLSSWATHSTNVQFSLFAHWGKCRGVLEWWGGWDKEISKTFQNN